jgi:hypothetical protein
MAAFRSARLKEPLRRLPAIPKMLRDGDEKARRLMASLPMGFNDLEPSYNIGRKRSNRTEG